MVVMMPTVELVVVIAFALLLLLITLWRRGISEVPRSNSLPEPSEYWVRLPRRALLDRCLSGDDLEFVLGLNSPRVLRLLLTERRRLAHEWLRQTRREALRLFRLHVRSARHAAGLEPMAELKLLSSMGVFLVAYSAMFGAVSLYGPFQTRRFLDSLSLLANVLSRCGSRIAASIPAPAISQAHAQAGVR